VADKGVRSPPIRSMEARLIKYITSTVGVSTALAVTAGGFIDNWSIFLVAWGSFPTP
jgi:hypothetical protein